MAEVYSLGFHAAGADIAAQVVNGGADQLVVGKTDWPIFERIEELAALVDAGAAGVFADGTAGCKLWVVAMLVSEMLYRDVDFDTSAWFMTDRLLHAETAAHALDAALNAGFGLVDGAPKKWGSIMHFAHDLGVWAKANRLAFKDACTVYEEDAVALPNAAFLGTHSFMNDLQWDRMTVGASLKPWLISHYLLHPMAPTMPIGAHDSPMIISVLLKQTAMEAFPPLAAASLPEAVLKLMMVEAPWQLVRLGDDTASRVALVTLLGKWATIAKRAETIQELFPTFLAQVTCEELAGWVGEMPDPFATTLRIAKQVLGDDRPSIDLVERLSAALVGFNTVWSDRKTQSENIDYLLQEVARGRAASAESKHALVTAIPDSTGEAKHALNDVIKAHYSMPGASELAAIRKVFESAHGPSIRWVTGVKGVKPSELPPDLALLGVSMPNHLHEYIIDGMKHDEAGVLDPALRKLTVATLYSKGGSQASKESFFTNVLGGNFAEVKWDVQFVAPLLRLSDPGTISYEEFNSFVYTDMERYAARLKLVGRLFGLLGKPPDVPDSFLAINSHWHGTYVAVRAVSPLLAEVCVQNVVTLMTAAWVNAGQTVKSSLAQAARWQPGFVSSTFLALKEWNTYAAGAVKTGEAMETIQPIIDHAVKLGIAQLSPGQSRAEKRRPEAGGAQLPTQAPRTHFPGVSVLADGQLSRATPGDPFVNVASARRALRSLGGGSADAKACAVVVFGGMAKPSESLEDAELRCTKVSHFKGCSEHMGHELRAKVLDILVEGVSKFKVAPADPVAASRLDFVERAPREEKPGGKGANKGKGAGKGNGKGKSKGKGNLKWQAA